MRRFTCLRLLLTIATLPPVWTVAAMQPPADESPVDESPEEAEAREAFDRFHAAVLRQPRPGTSFERVRAYHRDRGSLSEFIAGLRQRSQAGTATDSEWMLLGLLQQRGGDDPGAVLTFARARELRPDDPLAAWFHGQSLLKSGRPVEAVAALDAALALNPARSDVLTISQELARAARRAMQPERAEQVWRDLEQQFPDDPRVLEQIASTLSEDGDLQAALPRYERLVTLHSDPWQKTEAILQVAELKRQLQRSDEALADLEQLLDTLDADGWLARDVRRRVEELLTDGTGRDGITGFYEARLTARPDDVTSAVRLAELHAEAGLIDNARAVLQQTAQRAPASEVVQEALLSVALREQDYAAAIAVSQRLHELDPTDSGTIVEWGRLWYLRNDVDKSTRACEAEAVWKQLLIDHESDPLAHARVAELLLDSDQPAAALPYQQQAVTLAPDDPSHRERLGEIFQRLEQPEAALAAWREISAGERRTPDNLERLAEVFGRFGHRELSIATCREACKPPRDFARQLRFARLLIRMAEETSGEPEGPADSALNTARLVDDALQQLDEAGALAESADDRRAVLDERLTALAGSGRLVAATQALADRLKALPQEQVTPADWTELARYHFAASDLSQAIEVIQRALPDSSEQPSDEAIDGLKLAAELYEKAGRLADAADAHRRLARFDARLVSDHWQKVAVLEARLGRREQCLHAGRELLSSSPGHPDYSRFHAQYCLQFGERDEALTVLRKAMRANPSDAMCVRSLAETLHTLERMSEAAELYWQAFEQSEDFDFRLQVAIVLADLAGAAGQTESLLRRLEVSGDDIAARQQSARILATVCRELDDLPGARKWLERVLSFDRRNVDVLSELAALAEQTGDIDAAAAWLRQLVAVDPSTDHKQRLATLLSRTGDLDGAEAVRQQTLDLTASRDVLLPLADQLLLEDDTPAVARALDSLLARNPNDWEARLRRGLLEWYDGNRDAAIKHFGQLLAVSLPDDVPAAEYKARPAALQEESYVWSVTIPGHLEAALVLPPTASRVHRLIDLEQLRTLLKRPTEDTLSASQNMWHYQPGSVTSASPAPPAGPFSFVQNFGDARVVALAVFNAAGHSSTYDTTTQIGGGTSLQGQWDRLYQRLLEQDPDSVLPITSVLLSDGEARQFLFELVSSGDPQAQVLFVGLIPFMDAGTSEEQPPITEQDLQAGLLAIESLATTHPDWETGATELARVMQRRGLEADVRALIGRLSRSEAELRSRLLAVQFQAAMEPSDAVDQLAQLSADLWSHNPANDPHRVTSELVMSAAGALWSVIPGDDAADRTEVWMRLLDIVAAESIRSPVASPQPVAPGTRAPDRSPALLLNSGDSAQRSGAFLLRESGLVSHEEQRFLEALGAAFRRGSVDAAGEIDAWIQRQGTRTELFDSDPGTAAGRSRLVQVHAELYAVVLFEELGDRAAATSHLVRAVELSPDDLRLRAILSNQLHQLGESAAALQVLDQLPDHDPQLLLARERRALELASATGNQERLQQAAERLFGLQLDRALSTQVGEQLKAVGRVDLAAQIEARFPAEAARPAVRRARNSNVEDELEAAKKEPDPALASRKARQLLQKVMTPSGRMLIEAQNVDPNHVQNEALEILRRTGELEQMIEQQRQQIAARPDSMRLIKSQIQLLYAAGQPDEAGQLLQECVTARPQESASVLLMAATQLEGVNNVDGAAELVLQATRVDPVQVLGRLREFESLLIKSNLWSEFVRILADCDAPLTDTVRHTVFESCDALLPADADADDRAAIGRLMRKFRPGDSEPARRAFLDRLEVSYSADLVWLAFETFGIPATDVEARTSWMKEFSRAGLRWSSDANGRTAGPKFKLMLDAVDIRRSFLARVEAAAAQFPDWPDAEPLRLLTEIAARDEAAVVRRLHGWTAASPPMDGATALFLASSIRGHVPSVFKDAAPVLLAAAETARPECLRALEESRAQSLSLLMIDSMTGSGADQQDIRNWIMALRAERLARADSDPLDEQQRLNIELNSARLLNTARLPVESLRLLQQPDAGFAGPVDLSPGDEGRPSWIRTKPWREVFWEAVSLLTAADLTIALNDDLQQPGRPSGNVLLPVWWEANDQRPGAGMAIDGGPELLAELRRPFTAGPSGQRNSNRSSPDQRLALAQAVRDAGLESGTDPSLILAAVDHLVVSGDREALLHASRAIDHWLKQPVEPIAADSRSWSERQRISIDIAWASVAGKLDEQPGWETLTERMLTRAVAAARALPDHRALKSVLERQRKFYLKTGDLQAAEAAWSEQLDVILALPEADEKRPDETQCPSLDPETAARLREEVNMRLFRAP